MNMLETNNYPYTPITTTINPGHQSSISESVLHEAKYNPNISELLGITNTYNGLPAYHDFVLKAGVNSWGGIVDGLGGINDSKLKINSIQSWNTNATDLHSDGTTATPTTISNAIFPLELENPIESAKNLSLKVSKIDGSETKGISTGNQGPSSSGWTSLPIKKEYCQKETPTSVHHESKVGLKKEDGTNSASNSENDGDEKISDHYRPLKHIFRTEPFKINNEIYHRLVLPMPPQRNYVKGSQQDLDDPDPYGIGVLLNTRDKKGETRVTNIPNRVSNAATKPPLNSQRNYYNVMFWKNIYDIIHPRSPINGAPSWFEGSCAIQVGCAEHDFDSQCITKDVDGQVIQYYQCIRPYLWDPENIG